jgi:hypothetical protein
MSLTLFACANSNDDPAAMTESPAATDVFLQELDGTYEELFPVLNSSKYDDYWLEQIAAVAGQENAAMYAEVLKTSCTATIYGAEAVETYSASPENARFDCYFINGFDRLTFAGNVISGSLDGNGVFSHTYTYQGDDALGGMMDVRVYKTDDANAGEFTYFLFAADTPATTYHIEFRYGSDLDALMNLMDGSYAYWLAAGIPVGSSDEFVKSCIDLFVTENLEAGETTETAGFNLADFSNPFLGKWQSEIPSANTTLTFDFKPDGTFDYEMSGVPAEQGGKGSGGYIVRDGIQVTWLDYEGAAAYTYEVIDNNTINVTEFETDENGAMILGNTAPFTRVEGSAVTTTDTPFVLTNPFVGTFTVKTREVEVWTQEFNADGFCKFTLDGMPADQQVMASGIYTVYGDKIAAHMTLGDAHFIEAYSFVDSGDGTLVLTEIAMDEPGEWVYGETERLERIR